ncbi:hypothetical protein Fmac_027082 [Flemingia macrophylla]|uniref:S5 DRBM domain-containing protein n=1 Tax=Flemingia macrophylla TaxID=520843 RepID=A0ABD1LGX7_9FABA
MFSLEHPMSREGIGKVVGCNLFPIDLKNGLSPKGFDTRLIDMNQTCKVTKGGQVVKYTAMVACGNYNGVIGFAKAKGLQFQLPFRRYSQYLLEKFHNFIARSVLWPCSDVQLHSLTENQILVYLWHARTTTGMKAGRTVESILHLAGLKNVKSKVIGSRNPHNIVKAVFKALNAIETPRDVQEKFGRTVVEKYLL